MIELGADFIHTGVVHARRTAWTLADRLGCDDFGGETNRYHAQLPMLEEDVTRPKRDETVLPVRLHYATNVRLSAPRQFVKQ